MASICWVFHAWHSSQVPVPQKIVVYNDREDDPDYLVLFLLKNAPGLHNHVDFIEQVMDQYEGRWMIMMGYAKDYVSDRLDGNELHLLLIAIAIPNGLASITIVNGLPLALIEDEMTISNVEKWNHQEKVRS